MRRDAEPAGAGAPARAEPAGAGAPARAEPAGAGAPARAQPVLGQGQAGAPGEARLQTSRLTYAADGRLIIDGVDCTAPGGAVTGVLGPNGSGKSTLLRLVAGALEPQHGAILLSGADLRAMSRRERARRLALVEQENPPEVPLTVLDVVLLGRTPHRARWSHDSASDVGIARRSLERVGAGDLERRAFGTLSGGERQRVHLAAALAQEPRLLLLDEPANHLDVAAQLALLDLVGELTAGGVTVLMAMHDLNHALRWCDHAVLMSHGRVRAAGPPETVLSPELVKEVYNVRAELIDVGAPDARRRLLVFDRLASGSPAPPP